MRKKNTDKLGPTQRQLQVGEELRHALSSIITKGNIRNPNLVGLSITITEVRVSPDLSNATAFIMPLGGLADINSVLDGLEACSGYFRKEIASMVRLRVVPSIKFIPDRSFEEADKIERLLKNPIVARDLSSEETEK